jgi:subtilisin family serine protease
MLKYLYKGGILMKKFSILLLSIVTICFSLIAYHPPSTQAQSGSIDGKSKVIIFKESQSPNLQDLGKRLQDSYEVTVHIIPEIATLKVEGESEDQVRKAIEEIQLKFSNRIEVIGNEKEITPPSPPSFLKHSAGKPTTSHKKSSKQPKVNINAADVYQQWGWDIKKVTNNGASYKKGTGSHQVKVALIDSGIDFQHPDLKDNILSAGKSFVPGVSDTSDQMGHGTMVAGGMAANGRMLGVGPHLGIIPYKVFHLGNADSTWVIEAIIQAVKDRVDVINLSLGTFKSLNKAEDRAIIKAYQRAFRYADQNKVTVVASAGNEGFDLSNPSYLAELLGQAGDQIIHIPAEIDSVITVSGTTKSDTRSSASNFGRQIDFAAPSGDFDLNNLDVYEMVVTTVPTYFSESPINQIYGLPKGYTFMSGTSLAAPKVTGLVGVLIAKYKQKHSGKKPNPNYIKQILKRSSTDLGPRGRDKDFGDGLINADKALQLIK